METLNLSIEYNGTFFNEPIEAEVNLDNLYPVLLQTFTIIVLGYLSGRWKVIGQQEAKGLNTFVGNYALPCLIFTALAELDFSRVNWMFLWSILISKSAIFFVVLVFTLLTTRPFNLAKAGIFAIFCTQSNDFALGYPIVAALYGSSHPEYAQYLYVAAPVSLVLLNPLGFLCLEVGKRRNDGLRKTQSKALLAPEGSPHPDKSLGPGWKICWSVWKNMILSPAVLMTVLGIVCNLVFDHQIPPIFKHFFGVLGSAFSATALFALGLRMVGKTQKLRGSDLVAAGIIICVKCLVLPVVTREVTTHLHPGDSSNATLDLSNLGFLLGTFPTAPSVFFYAAQYNVAADMIATAMVACTFVSVPLTFVSARMVSLSSLQPSAYTEQLDAFLLHVAIVGLVCTSCMLGGFLASKKWKKVPHFATLCLTASQFMACTGVVLFYTMERSVPWKAHFQFFLFAVGVFGSRIWSALLSVTVLLLRKRNLWFVLKSRAAIAFVGFGIPLSVAIVLTCSVERTLAGERENPNFQYGKTQAFVAASILLISFTTTVTCLVLQQRLSKRKNVSSQRSSTRSHTSIDTCAISRINSVSSLGSGITTFTVPTTAPPSKKTSTTSMTRSTASLISEAYSGINGSATTEYDIESLFSPSEDLSPSIDVQLLMDCNKNTLQLTEPEESSIVRDRDDEYQILRHVILLVALCCSMFVGLALCVWTFIMEELTGIYIMLLFLDEILNFGQGVFVVVLFALDRPKRWLKSPVNVRWRGLFNKRISLRMISAEEIARETRPVCEQFITYHLDKCSRDLVRDRSWHLREYSNVFCGHELVDWLLMMGLCCDRLQAVNYGRLLLAGGVIYNVDGRKDFYDQPFFYSFC